MTQNNFSKPVYMKVKVVLFVGWLITPIHTDKKVEKLAAIPYNEIIHGWYSNGPLNDSLLSEAATPEKMCHY